MDLTNDLNAAQTPVAELVAFAAGAASRDAEIAELVAALVESRANDRTAMGYLSDIRDVIGGDDFPSMVDRAVHIKHEITELVAAIDSILDAIGAQTKRYDLLGYGMSEDEIEKVFSVRDAALAATPEQSLARIRNQVREECAAIARENHAGWAADDILATREPE